LTSRFNSITNFREPFVSLLVSTNKDTLSEQFELPNLGLTTARYLNQVELLVESSSEPKLVPQIEDPLIKQVVVGTLNKTTTLNNRLDISSNLISLLQSQLPKTITKIGL
jgi:hypothetical protein